MDSAKNQAVSAGARETAVYARFTKATEDYRDRRIDDTEYLAARKAWTDLLTQQDEEDGSAALARKRAAEWA